MSAMRFEAVTPDQKGRTAQTPLCASLRARNRPLVHNDRLPYALLGGWAIPNRSIQA